MKSENSGNFVKFSYQNTPNGVRFHPIQKLSEELEHLTLFNYTPIHYSRI